MPEIGHEQQYTRPANHVGLASRHRGSAPMRYSVSGARVHRVKFARMGGLSIAST
jgi:hypothetical protein